MQKVVLHIILCPFHKFIHVDIVAHFFPEVMDTLFFLLWTHLLEWLPFALVDKLLRFLLSAVLGFCSFMALGIQHSYEVLSLIDLLLLASIGVFMIEAHKFLIYEGAFRLKLFMFCLTFDKAEF